MVTVEEIKKFIEENNVSGPGGQPGFTYGHLPAPFNDVSYYRNNWPRLDFILETFDPAGKKILDIGCSTGHYCFELASRGAKQVLGVESNKNAVWVARAIREYLQVGEPQFMEADIMKTNVDDDYDAVLFFSSFQWIAKEHGLETAKEFLLSLSDCAKVLFFETAGSDSSAPLPEADSVEWIKNLLEECCWEVKDSRYLLCETGGRRWVWRCMPKCL